MLWLSAVLLHATITSPQVWYGPVEVTFSLSVSGSPFDIEENDIRVRFVHEEQPDRVEVRPAYWDGSEWRAVLLSRSPGPYRPVVIRNGEPVIQDLPQVMLSRAGGYGFIQIHDGAFIRPDGSRYFPVGHNLGWRDARTEMSVDDQLRLMGERGLNWSRIWSSNWDVRNPFWPGDQEPPQGRDMDLGVFATWADTVQAANESGVFFQWVLFNHGSFSTQVNPNWGAHPWNVENGGFLVRAEDFFTDAEAKRRVRNFLRYVIARFGHEPGIMAWELFNEVEWVDAIRVADDEAVVGEWHREMARFIRSQDPYPRLITTSSEMHLPIYDEVDFYQPHSYPPNVWSRIFNEDRPGDKPLFFGEYGAQGAANMGAEGERMVLRDGLWASLFAGHEGAAQYWFWERMVVYDLYDEFEKFLGFIRGHGLIHPGSSREHRIEVETAIRGDLTLSPDTGWGAFRAFEFDLDQMVLDGSLRGASSYIQGTANRRLMPDPLSLRFNSSSGGEVVLAVNEISASGGTLRVNLNGSVVLEESLSRNGERARQYRIPVPAGSHHLVIDNPGADWVVVSEITLPGVAPAYQVRWAERDWGHLVRIQRRSEDSGAFNLSNMPLPDGVHTVRAIDLDSGEKRNLSVTVANGRAGGLNVGDRADEIWFISPAS